MVVSLVYNLMVGSAPTKHMGHGSVWLWSALVCSLVRSATATTDHDAPNRWHSVRTYIVRTCLCTPISNETASKDASRLHLLGTSVSATVAAPVPVCIRLVPSRSISSMQRASLPVQTRCGVPVLRYSLGGLPRTGPSWKGHDVCLPASAGATRGRSVSTRSVSPSHNRQRALHQLPSAVCACHACRSQQILLVMFSRRTAIVLQTCGRLWKVPRPVPLFVSFAQHGPCHSLP